jgi:hypothetical protein
MRAGRLAPAAGLVAVLALGGCTTVRNATFPDRSAQEVFRAAVAGTCGLSGNILYAADESTGVLKLQTMGFFSGGRDWTVTVTSPPSGGAAVTVFMQGVSPLPDRAIAAIHEQLAAADRKVPAARPSAKPAAEAGGGDDGKAAGEGKRGAGRK